MSTILLERRDAVAVLSFNRPEKLNAISPTMVRDLSQALDRIEHDPEVRILVLTGNGRAFQAGADLAQLGALSLDRARIWFEDLIQFTERLEALPKPSIAAINGPCLGGGLEIALACTLRVMGSSAVLGLPEVRMGLMPGAGGIERLLPLIGRTRTAELVLTGRSVAASEALSLGLVNRVADDLQVLPAALALADQILANPSPAVALAKDSLDKASLQGLETALRVSADNCLKALATTEARERIRSFLDRKSRDKGSPS